jgi:L,D-transpeptidase ErfK/SrfK
MKITKLFFLTIFLISVVIRSTQASFFDPPASGNDLIGEVHKVKVNHGDTANDLRLKYELTEEQLLIYNPELGDGVVTTDNDLTLATRYILPEYRSGIVINIPELRLYYFPPNKRGLIFTAPVCLGRDGWRTPTTNTTIYKKAKNPDWYVPPSIKAAYTLKKKGEVLPNKIPGGSSINPLGNYALYLNNPRGYLIHGTIDPESIGRYLSSGCVRMQNSTIATLYKLAPVGIAVHIIHHHAKAGWEGNTLYLEVHQPIDIYEDPSVLNYRDAQRAIDAAVANKPATIDWKKVKAAMEAQTGLPTPIGIKK